MRPHRRTAILAAVTLVLMGCDKLVEDFLPSAYQEEEFSLANLDANAVGLLRADTLAIPVNASAIDTVDSLVADSVMVWPGDTNWEIAVPRDTSYIVYIDNQTSPLGNSTQKTTFFFDRIVSVGLTDEDGAALELVASHIPLETLAYGPEVQTRLEFEPESGSIYLMKLVTVKRKFHLVILHDL